jgi:hypothetical protein
MRPLLHQRQRQTENPQNLNNNRNFNDFPRNNQLGLFPRESLFDRFFADFGSLGLREFDRGFLEMDRFFNSAFDRNKDTFARVRDPEYFAE